MASMLDARNIAVFLPTWVGDAVMATPTLRALRRGAPDARITYVGRPAAIETLDHLPFFNDRVLDISHKGHRRASFFHMARILRKRRFDLALLLPNSFRSAAVATFAGIPRIAGYARDGRGWLLTDKLEPPRDPAGRFLPIPAVEYYARLLELLDVPFDPAPMSLAVAPRDAEAAEAMIAASGAGARPLVMLNPGASFGVSKMWSPARFAAVADALSAQRGFRTIINVSPAERDIGIAVAQAMTVPPAINMADYRPSLGLLKALVCQCALLVTNDTGARHVGAAFGIGVVTVFGSTDPLWSRIDYPRERIVRIPLSCSPCQQRFCPQPAGPFYHKCMNDISPDMVLQQALQLLDLCLPSAAGAKP